MHPTQSSHVKTRHRCTLAQRWANVVFSTNCYPTQSGRHTLVQCWPNVMHPTQSSHVKTRHRCTLAQRWANVVFSTNCYPTQSGRHTLVQCWPNVMHPTQSSHVKTRHRCTLAQRWANVLIPTRYRSDCQWQNVNVGAMLGQRCTSNPNHRPTVQPYANVGPT